MSAKTPIRTVFNDSNVATGLAEFQTGEFVPLSHGGIGAALSIGSAGQVLKVNTGGTALEFGAVEAIVNIDGATDLTGNTLVATDKLLISDGGSEGRVNLSQIDTLFKDTTQTFTNKQQVAAFLEGSLTDKILWCHQKFVQPSQSVRIRLVAGAGEAKVPVTLRLGGDVVEDLLEDGEEP